VTHLAVAIGSSLLTGVAHVILKRGALARGDRSIFRIWFNVATITGYLLLGLVTLMNLYAYAVVPLGAVVFLAPIPLCLVTILSVWIFGERMSRMQIAGCILILAGIVISKV
jgi:drug/metabolite transporter (DMT)-like permease